MPLLSPAAAAAPSSLRRGSFTRVGLGLGGTAASSGNSVWPFATEMVPNLLVRLPVIGLLPKDLKQPTSNGVQLKIGLLSRPQTTFSYVVSCECYGESRSVQ